MPINKLQLTDFSAGEIALRSSLEAKENQWLLLEGFILESNKRIRTQWEGATWVVNTQGSESS